MELNHQRVVLTGAASGIGRALMSLLANNSLHLFTVDIEKARLISECRKVQERTTAARITPYICDLSRPENIDNLFKDAVHALGEINLFIANAGFAYYESVEKPDWKRLEKIFQVNVFNSLYTIEKMAALNRDKPYKVVVTASAMAHIAVPGYAIYSSTKAALDRFADGYRWQMKEPLSLMLVYPIATRTKFFTAAGKEVPIPWPSQTPEVVARAILRGIQQDKQRVYPSALFRIIMFLDRFLPMHRFVQSLEQKRFEKWLDGS